VAERQGISVRYLEQVAVILRRSGFIRSIKGAFGGYTLAMPPEDISLGEVLRVLEGDMLVVDPPTPEETRLQRCIRSTVYDRLNERISRVIDRQTLSALIGTEANCGYMYYI
jgi:Rrf2 family protein